MNIAFEDINKIEDKKEKRRLIIQYHEDIETKLEFYAMEKYGIPVVKNINSFHYAYFAVDNESGSPSHIAIGAINLGRDKIVERVISIAHELGHAEFYVEKFKPDIEAYVDYREENLLRDEIEAWVRGIRILNEHGYNIWLAIEMLLDKHLKTYCENLNEDYEVAKAEVFSRTKEVFEKGA